MAAKTTTKSMEKLSEILRTSLSSKLKKADMENVLKVLSERQSEFLLVPTSTSRKAKKDPNAPKRHRSGYILFCTEERANVKKKYPDLSAKDLTVKLGELWRGLSEEKKKKFNLKSEEDKKRYEAEMEDYTPPEGTEAPQRKAKKEPKYGNIKHPLSGYMFFCKSQREAVKKDQPDLNNKDVTKELAARWKVLSEKQKEPYLKQAEVDRQRFDNEVEEAGYSRPERKSKASKSQAESKAEKSEKPQAESKGKSRGKAEKAETKVEKPAKGKAASKPAAKLTPGQELFGEEHRDEIESMHPTWSEKQVNSEIEKRWKSLEKDEQEDYEAEARVEDDDEEELDD